MFELIQVTAAYSNAVLLVVLTNVTDVANKLELPILQPVQPSHVLRFVCDPRQGSVGGWLTLTNGYEFWYHQGHVRGMASSHCYFALQDPDLIPRFFGIVRMSEPEIIQMARRTIRELGYNPPWLGAKPLVEAAKTAPQDRPNVVPHFRVTWKTIEPDGLEAVAEVEINADVKRVEKFWLAGRTFWREQPNIPQPLHLSTPPPSPPTGGRPTTPVPDHLRPVAIKEICAKITEMARKLNLPLELPIEDSQLKEATLSFFDNDLRGQFILTNGFRFHYRHGHVSAFYSPDSESNVGFNEILTNLPPVDTRKLFGKVRYTKEQITEFATREVRKLGYPDRAVFLDQPAFAYGGPEGREPDYVRYFVRWQSPTTKRWTDQDAQFTHAEVDGATLELKSLWLRSTNLHKPSVIKP